MTASAAGVPPGGEGVPPGGEGVPPGGEGVPPGGVGAAGGVVWRRGAGAMVELAVVHRPRYDDWSFPKGKLDPGETFAQAARREVAEETGLEVVVGPELPEVRYTDHRGRPKVVRWWAMALVGGSFVPNDEVDELRWVPLGDVARLLTYPSDAGLVPHVAAVTGDRAP